MLLAAAIFLSSLPLEISVFATSKDCAKHLSPIESPETLSLATQHLTSYLGELLKSQTIGDTELLQLLEDIKKGEIKNPISEQSAETNSKLLIHREGIERIIGGRKFDLKRLREWLQISIKDKKLIQEERNETKTNTESVYQKIEFHSVEPRRFVMGDENDPNMQKIPVTLTQRIEVMSTPMTQKQWVELFGENPSYFVGQNEVIKLPSGQSVKGQGDSPVEQITWWSAAVAANKLSERHGLKPAYDLSRITFKKDTRAGDGTLYHIDGELKINAPGGDITKAEGYRLLTEAEHENLLRLEFEQNHATDIKNRAWLTENALLNTHPVAELLPLKVNTREIYDLFGNVFVWNNDLFERSSGQKTVGGFDGEKTVCHVHGGSLLTESKQVGPGVKKDFSPNYRILTIGVRFARTLP